MAFSKLHSMNFFCFFFPQTPLPHPTQQLTLHPSKRIPVPLSLQPKSQFFIHTTLLEHPRKTQYQVDKECPIKHLNNPGSLSVAFPALEFANTLFFNSAYNVQVIVRGDEPEDTLIGRFRREVFRAGVIQESKRRRFFETTQEKKKRKSKRKTRKAARRNRKRFPKEVFRAGVIQESKLRRFLETTQKKRKRKAREAARRNIKRLPQSKASREDKAEVPKKEDDPEDDNWEFFDVDLPYC